MNEWITDRRPTIADGAPAHGYVFDELGNVVLAVCVMGPWKPIPKCEPYVKPRRWTAEWSERHASWTVRGADYSLRHVLLPLSDREAHAEAAERIAAIYEEVLP